MLQTYLITVGVAWQANLNTFKRYQRLEQLRELGRSFQLVLQEESRPVAIALLGESELIFHLGFDQSSLASSDWYKNPEHPYLEAVLSFLDKMIASGDLKHLTFLMATGDDPMTKLQGNLARKAFSLTEKPSDLSGRLETQVIYSFETAN